MRSGNTCGERGFVQRVRETLHGVSDTSTCSFRTGMNCRLLGRYDEQRPCVDVGGLWSSCLIYKSWVQHDDAVTLLVLRYDGSAFRHIGDPMLELESVRIKFPEDTNIIVGQTHFIKTAEDMYEAVVNTVPQAKFGLAFNEASGPCLTRAEGNDDELRNAAIANAQALGAGHVFVLILRNAYPINLLNVVQNIPEVCSIFCATANPVEVIVARTEQGRGVMGVIDGSSPKGVEGPAEINARKEFLRKIGYKR